MTVENAPGVKFYQLPGPYSLVTETPRGCKSCGETKLYKQPDFKRSLGLSFIVVASLSTFVLLYFNANWFAVWSPMFAVLIIDRILNWTSPLALICYECGHIHRGLSKDQCNSVEAFDLNVHDRFEYSKK